ncbi:sulfatase [Kiritimatiellaeota bacterium B1221]|nr:sulfatase [Kiritimatiellaeota bacterium B1221]
MNIVYLHAHDAGRYIQPYGFPFENPNLMKFAKQSVLFRKAFCAAPTCGPSRAALTSGQYPHQIGIFGLPGRQGWLFQDYDKHLVQYLNRQEYLTVLAGVQHEAPHQDFSAIGYQRILENEDPARPQAGEFYPETIDKVEKFLATHDHSQPFFLSIGIDEPHRDNLARPELNLHGKSDRFSKTRYYDPEKLDARYTAPLPWLPDLPEIRQDMEAYREGVKIMDEYMGRVFYALEQSGFDEDTLVLVTSDHGIEFPGGKKTLTDQGTEVMLLIRGPQGSGFEGGKVIEPMVSHLDIFPTLCDVLKIPAPDWLEGKSLVPLVKGECEHLHEAVFTEQNYHGPLEAIRAVRTERFKYLRFHEPVQRQMRHDGPPTPLMDQFGWYDQPEGTEALYDLYLDPMEMQNRIHDPALHEVKAELSAKLDHWMADTDDCFPSGSFPPIPGNP